MNEDVKKINKLIKLSETMFSSDLKLLKESDEFNRLPPEMHPSADVSGWERHLTDRLKGATAHPEEWAKFNAWIDNGKKLVPNKSGKIERAEPLTLYKLNDDEGIYTFNWKIGKKYIQLVHEDAEGNANGDEIADEYNFSKYKVSSYISNDWDETPDYDGESVDKWELAEIIKGLPSTEKIKLFKYFPSLKK